MELEIFSDFNLVGGTALALKIGHRKSVDIDLFGNCEIDEVSFVKELSKFGKISILQKSKNILITSINNIKVDFVNYHYPLLKEISTVENIRMVSKSDIAAMKLNAITGRGSKKDFIDLFFLFNFYSLDQMLHFYDEKYEEGSIYLVGKSLTYFKVANEQESPEMLKDFNWEEAKEKIKQEFFKL